MGGNTLLLGPVVESECVDLGRNVFRKQVLPRGTINHEGRKITFDDDYFKDVISAFNNKAFDQNTFQLASSADEHDTNPERTRGEVVAYEATKDGLDAILNLTDEGAKVVRDNPKLGVSPRIFEGMKVNGQQFGHAIHHIAGTLDPRNTGMGEWQEVEFSGEKIKKTYDLTAATIEELEEEVQKSQTESKQPTEPKQSAGQKKSAVDYTDEELDQLIAKLDEHMNGDEGSEGATDQSNGSKEEVDMSRQNDERDQRIAALELDLAGQRFENEAHDLIEAGVPPHLVELAKPILSLPQSPVVDLSNGSKVDVNGVIRKMLDACKGYVELAREQGHSLSGDPNEDREQKVLDAWANEGV